MLKKVAYLGVVALFISLTFSCEKDFTDIGTSVVNNGAFDTKDTILSITTKPNNIKSVRADNLSIGSLGSYLLGIYKSKYYKKIEASIVSQVSYIGIPKTSQSNSKDNIDSTYVLDKVVIRIPYPSTKSASKTSGGKPVFSIDGVLGNKNTPTSLKVLVNKTYLRPLDDTHTKSNSYESNYSYNEGENLTENSNFTFTPDPTDTVYVFQRTKMVNGVAQKFNDRVKIVSSSKDTLAQRPFLAIPLNTKKMKQLFWDEFNGAKFASQEAFRNYFKGLILKVEGNDGALIPFNFLSKNSSPTLDFYYTITRVEDGKFKDVLKNVYSFPLKGIRNSIYKMSASTTTIPKNNFNIQGTAGTDAEVTILDNQQIQKIRSKNWLINEASLNFYVNQEINQDTTSVPKKLFLYKNLVKGNDTISIQISDAYREPRFFGGKLDSNGKKPEKYTIKITDYISRILNGSEPISSLTLKVYNPTDIAISNKKVDTIVRTYNWNPRAVTLYNEDNSNGQKKAQLKISYSEKITKL